MNKRFIWNDCKITLKPGQSLEHYQGEPTDEGYSYRAVVMSHISSEPGKHDVILHLTSGGRDCDGEHRHYRDIMLQPDGTFKEVYSEEYDQYAQMAGY